MKWTTKKPEKTGWYWYRGKLEQPTPRKVYFSQYTSVWCAFDSIYSKVYHLDEIDGEWSDEPIPVPEEGNNVD